MCGPRRQTARIPKTATVDQVDDYTAQVADPYRWLEDLDPLATAAWSRPRTT